MMDFSTGRVAWCCLALAGAFLCLPGVLIYAYDINDRLSIGGIAGMAGQCQLLIEDAGASDACRGALPFRPHISYQPTRQDRLYAELGFAAGNGLNSVSPFQLSPWAADLEDEVKNINDRNRSYLMTAWYRHHFLIGADNVLGATLGLIDSTDYLDNNKYANDEYTQFMNEAFVNTPQVSLPSYDWGAALQWDIGLWSLRAVYMNVGLDEEEITGFEGDTNQNYSDSYDFVGFEIGYLLQTGIGEGNYRVVYTTTSDDFNDPLGNDEQRLTVAISFNQELGDSLGAFLRVLIQSEDAVVRYRNVNVIGLDIRGNLWGRVDDNIGLGIGYLDGGNQKIINSYVAETYYRFIIDERFALTGDLQYMQDIRQDGKNPEGFILGLRADIQF